MKTEISMIRSQLSKASANLAHAMDSLRWDDAKAISLVIFNLSASLSELADAHDALNNPEPWQ
jgi:hypothetical protein